MLKLSKKADYALVALSHLSKRGLAASAKEIAQTYELSAPMLANVLKVLASSGFLTSTRGAQGGYSLSQQPKLISVGQVIALFDGESSFSDCSSKEKDCVSASNCPARRPMLVINKKIKDFMHGISLADLSSGADAIGFQSSFSLGRYHE